MPLSILQLSCRFFFWQSITSPRSVSPLYSPDLAPCDLWLFPKLKSPLKGRRFVNAPSQRRLTADWLAPRVSDCSRLQRKVSSNRLQSYIKATRPVFEIFKMDGYFRTVLVYGVITEKRIWEPQTPCSAKRCLSRSIQKIQWPQTLQAYLWTWHWWTVVSPIHIHVVTHTVLLTTWRCRRHHGGGCPLRGRPHIIWRRTCSNRKKMKGVTKSGKKIKRGEKVGEII